MGTVENRPTGEGGVVTGRSSPSAFDRLVQRASASEELLWLFVLVVLVVDVWTTHVGLQHGLTEANPVMHRAIHGVGFEMLGVAKVAVLALGALVRVGLSENGAVVPLGLALPWLVAVLVNVVMLAPAL